MRLRDRFGISERRQRQASRAMQLSLLGFVFVGIYETNPGITVNAGLGLLITYIPAIMERDYDIPMDAGLTLWITSAVFLHALGVAGLPGGGENFYGPGGIPWWDHLTHALSSSVVTGAGYAAVRGLDEHHDDIELPSKFVFVFLLLFVLAFGVLWEVIEFAIMSMDSVFGGSVLTVYGIGDTILDLVFNTIGGILVAIWGTAYLTDVSSALRRRFARSSAGK